jgi:hypothetical protein
VVEAVSVAVVVCMIDVVAVGCVDATVGFVDDDAEVAVEIYC